ncbi:MAG: hypothetical protein H6Q72_4588 [Firmicutes bacterium]|nr:hypothetical protein [Bacillota bacterium]
MVLTERLLRLIARLNQVPSEAGTISISSASYLDIELNTVASGATYSLTLDKSTYTYTATSSDETTILVAIAALLSSLEATVTVSNSHLYIDKTDHSSGYSVSISTNMTLNEIGSPLEFACDTYGEIDPDVGTVTKIVTQIFGWNSVKNNVEATVGREDETDSELRQRYGSAVFQTGSAMVESIQAAIADLDGVTMANVYENVSDEIDSDGRPPHSIEAVVYGGTKSEIAEVLWKKKAPGISTYGSVEVDVTDSQSIKHTMKFNRPTVKSVWIKAVLEENPDEDFAADNPTEVQSLILAKGQALSVGQDVILQRFLGPIYSGTTGIGTVTITAAVSDTTPASSDYSADNISIGAREIADFSTDRIEVTTA